jgi:streptogramin lyase
MMASMTRTRLFAAILLVPAALVSSPDLSRAQTTASASLAGRVNSQEEGPMEGVLVSAKRAGSTITVTVSSDQQGLYSFPRSRLEPGQYALSIRAVGYDLENPAPVEVTAQKTASLDLKLRKTQDLAAQLTNAEWLMSMPGTEDDKAALMGSCITCHTLERIVRSHYDAAAWTKVIARMKTYMGGTIPEFKQVSPYKKEAQGDQVYEGYRVPSSQFLSSINLSSVPQWKYTLKTLPRLKGKSTRVIVTTYDLPRRQIIPHDMSVGTNGIMWYCDNGQQYMGRLDSKTGKVVEFPVPVLKPGMPTGCRTMEFDSAGNMWVGLKDQSAVGKFDLKTEKFQTFMLPPDPAGRPQRVENVLGQRVGVDGKVWAMWSDYTVQRLDAKSGEWERESIELFGDIPKNSPWAKRPHFGYDVYGDPQNNLWFTDFRSELIGKVDAKTKKISYWQTPTYDSGPRRAHFDSQGRLWFGEYRGNRIGMFDPKTERFQEWALPTPLTGSYDAILDKSGYAWTGGMTTDRVARLNTKTGEIVEYMLPNSTNIRKVDVDDSANPPAFWVGNNQKATLVKVEPLD